MTIITIVSGKRIRIKRKRPGPKPLPLAMKRRSVNISLSPYWHERGKGMAAVDGVSFWALWKNWWYMQIRCAMNWVKQIIGAKKL